MNLMQAAWMRVTYKRFFTSIFSTLELSHSPRSRHSLHHEVLLQILSNAGAAINNMPHLPQYGGGFDHLCN